MWVFFFRKTFETAVDEREDEIEGSTQKIQALEQAKYVFIILVNILLWHNTKSFFCVTRKRNWMSVI